MLRNDGKPLAVSLLKVKLTSASIEITLEMLAAKRLKAYTKVDSNNDDSR